MVNTIADLEKYFKWKNVLRFALVINKFYVSKLATPPNLKKTCGFVWKCVQATVVEFAPDRITSSIYSTTTNIFAKSQNKPGIMTKEEKEEEKVVSVEKPKDKILEKKTKDKTSPKAVPKGKPVTKKSKVVSESDEDSSSDEDEDDDEEEEDDDETSEEEVSESDSEPKAKSKSKQSKTKK